MRRDNPNYMKEYRKKNKEKLQEMNKEYYQNNKEKFLEKAKDWSEQNQEKTRETKRRYRYKKYYNTTIEEVEENLEAQSGKCCICEKDITEKFHVDHDHDTGNARGLLCVSCNSALGKFNDDPEMLKRAAKYLERNTWLILV